MKGLTSILFLGLTFLMLSCAGEEEGKVEEVNEKAAQPGSKQSSIEASISGKMVGASNIDLYVYQFGGQNVVVLDTIKVGEDGSFVTAISQNGYAFLGIGENAQNVALVLLGAGDQIQVNGSREGWLQDYTVSGTGFSPVLREYFIKRQEFTDKIKVLQLEVQSLAKDDVEGIDKINLKGKAMQAEFETYRDKFIKDNADSPVAFAAFQDIYDPIADLDKLKTIKNAMNKFMPNSPFTNQVNDRVAMVEQQIQIEEQKAAMGPNGVEIGSVAPDLNFPGLGGKNISLSSLKGKVVLLDFWASWCKPCRMENPNVVKLYNQYKDKGFTVYSYSLDNSKDKWQNAIQVDGLIWPNHVSDLKGWNAMGAALYGVNSIPQTFLIGADGKIIARDLRGEELAKKLKEILG